MITFDWTMEDDEPAYGSQPMLPDGKHVAKIAYVKCKTADWCKGERNPDGSYLLLGLDVTGHARVWDSIPINRKARVQAVCLAAKVPLPTPDAEWDELTLLDEYVTINSELRTSSKSNKEYVAIRSYDARQEEKKPTKSRAVKKKQEEVDVAPDDIPF
tara:strand:- start:1223 stop:1696 length:474 start_codon:yes stop_codon:yes gene_type:complete